MAQYINDNGEFYNGGSIVIGDRRYLSPNEEILLLAGYHLYVPPELTEEQLLEQARDNKLYEITNYDESSNVNIFYLVGQPMWLDSQTRQTLRISIESYRDMGYDTVTKWFNGQHFTFPISSWISMLNALEIYAAEALNVTEMHRAAVSQLETVEEIEAYDITTGYPEVLNLSVETMIKAGQNNNNGE